MTKNWRGKQLRAIRGDMHVGRIDGEQCRSARRWVRVMESANQWTLTTISSPVVAVSILRSVVPTSLALRRCSAWVNCTSWCKADLSANWETEFVSNRPIIRNLSHLYRSVYGTKSQNPPIRSKNNGKQLNRTNFSDRIVRSKVE